MKPRGLRNNNPLNIRHNADLFQGEIKGNDKLFKTFSSMPYGYRAAFVILATYLSRGDNTIEKIISRWAPPSENKTQTYISTVVKYSGVTADEILTATSGDQIYFDSICNVFCRKRHKRRYQPNQSRFCPTE